MKKWLLLSFLPTIAFAGYYGTPESGCTSLDFRNDVLGDVRNQRDVAWCYGFTAADMLGNTHYVPEKISAAHISMSYNDTKLGRLARWLSINIIKPTEENRSVAHQTGFNMFAIRKAQATGWCPERVLPSEFWTKMVRVSDTWVEVIQPLKESMLDIAALYKNRHALTADTLPYYFAFKNVDAAKFLELLQTKKLDNFYADLSEEVCKDDIQEFDKHWKVKMVIRNSRIFGRLNEQLNLGRVVGLDYDSRVLANLKNPKLSLSELHTSTIVGRRWKAETQSCQYLVRNSYGQECSTRYDAGIECEAGHLWLDESRIYPNMTSIVYMLSPRVR